MASPESVLAYLDSCQFPNNTFRHIATPLVKARLLRETGPYVDA